MGHTKGRAFASPHQTKSATGWWLADWCCYSWGGSGSECQHSGSVIIVFVSVRPCVVKYLPWAKLAKHICQPSQTRNFRPSRGAVSNGCHPVVSGPSFWLTAFLQFDSTLAVFAMPISTDRLVASVIMHDGFKQQRTYQKRQPGLAGG